jgi:hypothetical protein
MTVLTVQIFERTRDLPPRHGFTAWSRGTSLWPQMLLLVLACGSFILTLATLAAYCKRGHKSAEKVARYSSLFSLGIFIFSAVSWAIAGGTFHFLGNDGGDNFIWSWSCADNQRRREFSENVNYNLICRMQVSSHPQ